MYEKLRNLNDLNKSNVRGINKQWIYSSINDYNLVCNYLQKINYSIQDINEELSNKEFSMKEIIYIITLIDWIKDSYSKIVSKIRKDVINKFENHKNNELEIAREYFVAIRSYIVAHPLSTNRHKKYGFDGDFICVDLNTKDNHILKILPNDEFYNIDYFGLHPNKNENHQYYLLSYSRIIDENKNSKFISFSIDEVLNVARLYIESLYELNEFLSKEKKQLYKVNSK